MLKANKENKLLFKLNKEKKVFLDFLTLLARSKKELDLLFKKLVIKRQ